MNPVLIRAAARSATQVAARRQFSMLTSMRNFARSFESHPFERLPVTQNSQAGDWSKQMSRASKQIALFVPSITCLLFWPIGVEFVMDGHI